MNKLPPEGLPEAIPPLSPAPQKPSPAVEESAREFGVRILGVQKGVVVPKVFSKEAQAAFLDEADAYLAGDKKADYMETVTGASLHPDTERFDFAGSRDLIAKTLPIFADVPVGARQEFLLMSAVDPRLQEVFLNYIHWLWRLEQFPWTAKEISDEEKKLLREVKATLYAGFRDPVVGPMLGAAADEAAAISDMPTMFWMSENRTTAIGGTTQDVLRMTAFTGNPFDSVAREMQLDDEDLQECAQWGDVLDLGCGFSEFAHELRKRGATAYTLDELSIDELRRKLQGLKENAVTKTMRDHHFLESSASELTPWHKKGTAEDTARIFGEGRFAKIFASDSITQPVLYPLYEKPPIRFWRAHRGPLQALSPEGGELCTTGNPMMFLYTEKRMRAFFLPFLLSMQMGRFEIPGCYDAEGNFSFKKFVNTYVRFDLENQMPLRVRRHPESDITKADQVMTAMLMKKTSPRKVAL